MTNTQLVHLADYRPDCVVDSLLRGRYRQHPSVIDFIDRICAQVAELVDALASGASGLMVVEVRVFSWAPFFTAPI